MKNIEIKTPQDFLDATVMDILVYLKNDNSTECTAELTDNGTGRKLVVTLSYKEVEDTNENRKELERTAQKLVDKLFK